MPDKQYNAKEILEEACRLIPVELMPDQSNDEGDDLKSHQKEVECLTKLFAVNKEDLQNYYSKLNDKQRKKIRSAVDTICPLLLLSLEKVKHSPKIYTKIYDALRLLAHYFPTNEFSEQTLMNNPANSQGVFSSFCKENMLVYAVICSAALVCNYDDALKKKHYPLGMSRFAFLMLDTTISSTKDIFFAGIIATASLSSKKLKKICVFLTLFMTPIPAMIIKDQSKEEKEISFMLILAGIGLSFALYAMVLQANKNKYKVDPQKEAFFKSLSPLPDENRIKEQKAVKNTSSILEKLAALQPGQQKQKKSIVQPPQKECSASYSSILKPPRFVEVKPATPEQELVFKRFCRQ